MKSATACVLLLLTCLSASAGEVKFTKSPTAKKAGAKVTISFAVSAETDVAVYVLDAKGKVVRHLVAGVLGKNPPAPLKPGLSQSVEWDLRDDLGRPARGGPFKVRVCLALEPAFDRMIGHNPAQLGHVRGLATGPDGTVYVFSTASGFGSGASGGRVLAFDRSGKYLRQVVPYPANLPEEKLKGLKRIEVAKGVKVPFVYNGETRALFPGLGGEHGMVRGVVTADGRLALPGVMEVFRDRRKTARVVMVNTDGSTPPGGVLGTVLHKNTREPASLALSPDGKTVYAAGMRDGPYAGKNKFLNTVYAFGWGDKEVKPFVSAGLNGPRSVAVDKDGNIYVADKGNNRVAVFKPDGSALGELKVEKPERVEVHPQTGAVYVLGGARVNELQKFASWKKAAAVAKVALPSFRHRFYTALIALDGSARTPVVWVGSVQGYFARFGLLRIEDKGGAFGEPVDITKLPENSKPSAGRSTDLILAGDRLYCWSQRGGTARAFNARTGEALKLPRLPRALDGGVGFIFSAGRDGNFYMLTGHVSGRDITSSLFRYDATFKSFPFPKAKEGRLTGLGSPRTRLRGMCADLRGNAYLLRQKGVPKLISASSYGDANVVSVYDREGKLVNDKLIDSDIRSLNSVRVDPAGNVYLAVGARPGKQMIPAHLEGQVPDGRKDPAAECGHNYYPLMYGSIVKFGPEGGVFRKGIGGKPLVFGYGNPIEVKGAKWIYFGASLVPSFRTSRTPNICLCESPRFDVDGFGRSFFPDACGFRVGVLDTNGNLIRWFGTYGNQDSAGPESAIPKPEMPIGWVHAVAVDDGAAFVGDRISQRVVRVKLGYAAEATCALP